MNKRTERRERLQVFTLVRRHGGAVLAKAQGCWSTFQDAGELETRVDDVSALFFKRNKNPEAKERWRYCKDPISRELKSEE